MPERAGVWVRVSTGGQEEASQIPDCLRHCETRNYDVQEPYYTVHGKSAYHGAQDPDWQRVVKDVKDGKIQVVVIWKVDRLDRQNMLHAIPMVNAVLDLGGRVEFATQSIDLTTTGGRIGFAIFCEQAYEESRTKSDRVRIKFDALKANNALIGRPPFGYRVTGTQCGQSPCLHKGEFKTLQPDPVTVEIARQMVALYFKGFSWGGIARWLNNQNIPSVQGGKWRSKVVGQVLRNESLIGRRRDSNGKIILRFEPLTDTATWSRLQAMMDANAKRRGQVSENAELLTRAARCGRCGGRMHFKRVRRPSGTYLYYRCDGTDEDRSHCKNMMPAAAAEQAVDLLFTTVDVWDVADKEIVEIVIDRTDPREEEIRKVLAAVSELDPLAPDFMARVAPLHAQLQDITSRERPTPRPVPNPTGITVAEYWRTLDKQAKHAYLLQAGVTVFIDKGGNPDVWAIGHPEQIEGVLAFKAAA